MEAGVGIPAGEATEFGEDEIVKIHRIIELVSRKV